MHAVLDISNMEIYWIRLHDVDMVPVVYGAQ